MLNNHRLIRNTTIYALGDIIPKFLGFLLLPILTNYLTPAHYGIANYVNAVSTLLSVVGLLGLNTYYLVHYFKQGDELSKKRLLGNLSIFTLGINIIVSALLFAVGAPLFDLFEGNISFYPYIALGVGASFFSSFFILPSALYRLRENPLPLTLLNIAKAAVQLGLTLLLVVKYNMNAMGVLWANFLSAAVFGLIFAAITWRHSILCFDWGQMRSALKFSLPLVPGAIAYFAIMTSDRILIDHYLNTTDVGIYGTAATLAMLISIVSYGAYRALEPHFFKEFGSDGFERMFKKIRNAFLVLLLFMALGLSLFAREFFEIFANPRYHSVYIYVPLTMIGLLAYGLSMLYNTVVTARGLTKINSTITIVGGIVSVGLNILLLPLLGLFGACVVSGIVFSSMLFAHIRYAALHSVDHLRPILAVLIAAISIFIGVYWLPVEDFWMRTTVKTVIFIAANIAILATLGQTPRKLLLTLQNRSQN